MRFVTGLILSMVLIVSVAYGDQTDELNLSRDGVSNDILKGVHSTDLEGSFNQDDRGRIRRMLDSLNLSSQPLQKSSTDTLPAASK